MRARPPQTDWRTYLDASLFPLKIFIVLAVVCLIGWHALLPQGNSRPWDFFISKPPEANPMWDFYVIASWTALAYVVSAIVLTVSGVIQAFFSTRRAAIWSLSFAIAGLIISIWLKAYGKEALQGISDAYNTLIH